MAPRVIQLTSPARPPRRVYRGERPSASNTNMGRELSLQIQTLRNAITVARPRPWAENMLHAIVNILPDYIECVRVWRNQTLGAEIVYVAKPPRLRAEASWNGITYTGYSADGQERTATRAPDSETQRITPDYVVGDFIEVSVSRGLTGITIVDEQRGRPIDKNVDGRAWAKVEA